TASDLTRDQDYVRVHVAADPGDLVTYRLRGPDGALVAELVAAPGLAPFTLDRFMTGVAAAARAGEGHSKQIDIHSWSFGPATATLPGGVRVAVTDLEVGVAPGATATSHELGHLLGISHVALTAVGPAAALVSVE
ncbi:MAG: hypothetical protein IT430_15935, partial [Phycisphaerales bacterium]|nr:hypothetical protein [Phycisphaerales bacterium]